MRDAVVAMHRARELGGGRHQVFDAPMHEDVVGRLQLEAELRRRDAETFVVAGAGTAVPAPASALLIPLDLPEELTPLVTALPGQLLALHLSLARGLDPDTPRGLRKVTKTY